MALKFFWRCEGTTLDGTHDFTAGDNTATLNSAAVINTDAVRVGTNGLDCPTSNDHAKFVVSSGDIIHSTTGSFALSFRITTFTAGAWLFTALNTGASTNFIQFDMVGTDDATGRELRFQIRQAGNPAHSITTTGADLAEGTWYAAVCRYDQTANDIGIEVYNSDGSLRTSIYDTTTSFLVPTGINELRIGEGGGTAVDEHIDNVFCADAYAEPLEDFLDITSYTAYGASGGEVAGTPHQDLSTCFGPARAARLNGVIQ